MIGEDLLSQLSESAVTYLEDILTSLGARISVSILFESYQHQAEVRSLKF